MSRWILRNAAAVCLCTILAGCANVKVEKVNLQDRVCGADTQVKGFRYYLTRPYLVISSRIDVATTYKPVWPAVLKTDIASQQPSAAQSQSGKAPVPASEPLFAGNSAPQLYFASATEADASGGYLVYDHDGKTSKVSVEDLVFLSATVSKADNGNKPLTAAEFQSAFINAAANVVATKANAVDKVAAIAADFSAGQYALLPLLKVNPQPSGAIGKLGSGYTQTSLDDAVAKSVTTTIVLINKYLKDKLSMTAKPFENQELENAIKDSLPKPTGTTPMGASGASAMATAKPAPKLTPNTTPPTDGSKTSNTTAPAQQNGTPVQDTLPYQVVFLPDFEEQYAIRHINFAAKTKYHYTFRNGTDLETATGGYDSTDVPVAIVQTVGALLTAVSQIAPSPAKALPKGTGAAKLGLDETQLVDAPYYLRINVAIEPGVYRVQKSWERAAAAHTESMPSDELCGLFGDVGLELVESVSIIDAKTHTSLTQKPKSPTGSDSPPDPTSGH